MRRGLAPSSHVDGLLPVTGEHSENKVVMKWGDLDVNLGSVAASVCTQLS